MLVINDLRQVCGDVSLVHLDWQLLAQLAQARRDETLRQVTWAETKLKESVVQAFSTP